MKSHLPQQLICPEPSLGSCNMGQSLIWPCIPWITNPPTTPLSQPSQPPKIRSTAPPPSLFITLLFLFHHEKQDKLSRHPMSDVVQNILFIHANVICLFTSVNTSLTDHISCIQSLLLGGHAQCFKKKTANTIQIGFSPNGY